MANPSFASLHAGLLARKGEARPSAEAALAHVLRRPVTAPVETPPSFVASKPGVVMAPPAPAPSYNTNTANEDAYASDSEPDYNARVREALSAWPAPTVSASTHQPQAQPREPAPAPEYGSWVPDMPNLRHPAPVRATVRLTQMQARALRLASLVLDRPQQDLIQAGLASQLEALACTDLANCACFKAAIAGLPNA
jgi:hypothetical protein